MDSKKLSEKKRNLLSEEIKEKAIAWCIERASPEEIDTLNILHATMLAMQRAVNGLSVEPDYVLVDGNRTPSFHNEMIELDKKYPQYGFAGHKGYPTKAHLEKIVEYGVLDCYRMSFKPVAAVLNKS